MQNYEYLGKPLQIGRRIIKNRFWPAFYRGNRSGWNSCPVHWGWSAPSSVHVFRHPGGSFTGEEEIGRTLEEGVEIAKRLESYGYDCLNVDTGIYDSFCYACPPMYMPKGYLVELSAKAKEAVNIPLLAGAAPGAGNHDRMRDDIRCGGSFIQPDIVLGCD